MASENYAIPAASLVHHNRVRNRQGLRILTRRLASGNHDRMDCRSCRLFYVELRVLVCHGVCYLFFLSRIFILDIVELNPPRHLSSFFKSDLVRVAVKLVSVTSPQYCSDEIRIPLHGPLPVTGYRLLTCTAVMLFGITKAYLAYQDLSSDANALDWIYGIIVVSW